MSAEDLSATVILSGEDCATCKGRGRERMLYTKGATENFIDGLLCRTCEGTGKTILRYAHYSEQGNADPLLQSSAAPAVERRRPATREG